MATITHLTRDPITEALIDISVVLPSRFRNLDHLGRLTGALSEDYPDKKQIHQVTYQVKFAPEPKNRALSTPLGYKYTSLDGRQVIQATITGFTFSRLTPYEDWASLRKEAWRIWQLYSSLFQPESITRVAARYINKLELPGPTVDFDDYLKYVPAIPNVLPQSLSGFFSRVVVPEARSGITAIVTQSFQPGQMPSEVPVILDIDVIKEKAFGDESEAWSTIDQLRGFKNMIFFDSITERVVELYK
jgi:uncharacterized protein (TIGR04255 family)